MAKKKIRIHNSTWKVKTTSGRKLDLKESAKDGERIFGLTTYEDCLIEIRKGIGQEASLNTIRHELAHAYAWEYGSNITGEESMCDFIGAFGEDIALQAEMIAEEFFGPIEE